MYLCIPCFPAKCTCHATPAIDLDLVACDEATDGETSGWMAAEELELRHVIGEIDADTHEQAAAACIIEIYTTAAA